jgi:hypothetical protein
VTFTGFGKKAGTDRSFGPPGTLSIDTGVSLGNKIQDWREDVHFAQAMASPCLIPGLFLSPLNRA